MPQSQKNEPPKVVYPDVFRRTTSANTIAISSSSTSSLAINAPTTQDTYSTLLGFPYLSSSDLARDLEALSAITASGTPIFQSSILYGIGGTMGTYYPFGPEPAPHIVSEQDESMNDGPTREEIDAKLGKLGAETDTKIVRMEGKLDLVLTKLDYVLKDNQETRDTIRAEGRSGREITWGVGIGAIAIIIGILALFPSMFGMGSQVRDMVRSEVQQSLPSAVSAVERQKH